MDCSMISPAKIELLNFLLSFIPWIPAVAMFFLVATHSYSLIRDKYPGYDNDHRRTALSAIAGIVAMAVFFAVWGSGLLLVEGFRCSFL